MLIRTLIRTVEPVLIRFPSTVSYSTSTALWKKKKAASIKDPIRRNIEELPLEETLPTDDGEPRPNSAGHSLIESDASVIIPVA